MTVLLGKGPTLPSWTRDTHFRDSCSRSKATQRGNNRDSLPVLQAGERSAVTEEKSDQKTAPERLPAEKKSPRKEKGEGLGEAIWKLFSSVKLAIILLLLLAVVSIIGTVLAQGDSAAGQPPALRELGRQDLRPRRRGGRRQPRQRRGPGTSRFTPSPSASTASPSGRASPTSTTPGTSISSSALFSLNLTSAP